MLLPPNLALALLEAATVDVGVLASQEFEQDVLNRCPSGQSVIIRWWLPAFGASIIFVMFERGEAGVGEAPLQI